ncbi:MAG: hypothetical protein A2283_17915 [Lentisphaerae bacterium RIFOXYA12_FULL_48_11]|nr:MAG: hypothetical protein A2283_17915 [Lentisphaerae bacterium RIFOXYA12_FULL_48_11]
MLRFTKGYWMNNIGYVFIDDGYPESCDYDNNYIAYVPKVPGSLKHNFEEINSKQRGTTGDKGVLNILLQPRDIPTKTRNLLETSARETQDCIKTFSTNIGKPDVCFILDRFSTTYGNARTNNTSINEDIHKTYFSHASNRDIFNLVKSLRIIIQTARTFIRRLFLLTSHIDTDELAGYANLITRISDAVTDMMITFCRNNNPAKMASYRRNLQQLEEESDKLMLHYTSTFLRRDSGPAGTVIRLALFNSMKELINVHLESGNSLLEIHLKYT